MEIPFEATALGGVAAGVLVELMVTEGWNKTRDWFDNFSRRHRGESSERDIARLDSARNALIVASQGEREALVETLETEWSVRMRDFLDDHPDAIAEVRDFLAEHDKVAQKAVVGHNITINARADRKSTQNITGIGNIGIDPRK
ncbi:hypothetical protein GCM10010492_70360 [Saccharothrix mutabilis subsp. mutabilis]|uniref:Uncharacterized protein n=1 Tax=Saccharothrix mutabilis subsp. mutabilis TaxID=66855 RepID=A0ABN0URK5_9PSEU